MTEFPSSPTTPTAPAAPAIPEIPVNLPAQPVQTRPTYTALVIAILWAIASLIIGIHFITSTPNMEFGGDAYTGIQQAAAQTARAVGYLIIGTGALGLVIANARGVRVIK